MCNKRKNTMKIMIKLALYLGFLSLIMIVSGAKITVKNTNIKSPLIQLDRGPQTRTIPYLISNQKKIVRPIYREIISLKETSNKKERKAN